MQIIKGRYLSGEHIPGRSVNASQLERWIGRDELEGISQSMRHWQGPPIAVANVPGKVFACGGGDFRGELRGGFEASLADRLFDLKSKFNRGVRHASRSNLLKFGAGFASLADLIAEAKAGKLQEIPFQKVGTSSGSGQSGSHWTEADVPAAGSAGAAAPGGTVASSATTGAMAFRNPISGDRSYLVGGETCTAAPPSLLLYDRLFSVAKTMNSTATEAVTGVPTRYQSTTITDEDYIGGNFLTVECVTALPATAHNWDVCTYTDQSGAASTFPLFAGVSSCFARALDIPLGFIGVPLEAGDTGVQTLTQMQCSALVATGAVDFMIGHPIAFFAGSALLNTPTVATRHDFILSAFNLVRIFDDACLAWLDCLKNGSGGVPFRGSIRVVSG